MACREENIPDVGSYVVYDIAGDSYLVVRTRDGIKAYVNACLHRGRALKDYDGRCSEFRCSFHGFTWRLDGSLRYTPAPGRVPGDRGRTATTGGCRRPRSGCGAGSSSSTPIRTPNRSRTFLGTLPEHFARWDFEHRYLQAHVAKKIRCNWKVAQEAFDEGLHLGATHPQSAPYVGDANAAVDVYGNYSRQISPSGTPIEDMPGDATEADILKRMLDVREGEDLPIPFSQRSTARDAMAAGRPGALAAGARRRGGRHLRRRTRRPLELRGVPEPAPVGRLQPDRVPVPAERRPARRVRSSRSCS